MFQKNIKKQIKTLNHSIEKLREDLRNKHQVFENIQINDSIDLPKLNNAEARRIEDSKVRSLDQNVHNRFWQKEFTERDIKTLIDEKNILIKKRKK
jgi:archaellum component FlaC